MTRYAVYFSPPAEHPLVEAASAWLGRNAFSGEILGHKPYPALSAERLHAITASPRRYGFHATMKAPFSLAEGKSEADLLAAFETFGADTAPFSAPALTVQSLGGFLALLLSAASSQMDALEALCVRYFEPFRAPLSAADMDRRLRANLSERHKAQLAAWGYPYVFEDFTFHMTLTERLTDETERSHVLKALAPFSEIASEPLAVDGMCLFRQPSRDEPFSVLSRVQFSGS